jgi:hypothetical protein
MLGALGCAGPEIGGNYGVPWFKAGGYIFQEGGLVRTPRAAAAASCLCRHTSYAPCV